MPNKYNVQENTAGEGVNQGKSSSFRVMLGANCFPTKIAVTYSALILFDFNFSITVNERFQWTARRHTTVKQASKDGITS